MAPKAHPLNPMAADDIRFESISPGGPATEVEMDQTIQDVVLSDNPYPKAILPIKEDKLDKLKIFLDDWLESLLSSQQPKLAEWAKQEEEYRAVQQGPRTHPFVGACGDIVPVSAMAVDPIHARLDTGIFKADPVFSLKGLKKSVLPYIPALEVWIEYYQKYKAQLRTVASPRLLEMTKHGTCAFKTVYDRERYKIKTYDPRWNVISKEVTRFSGPRTFGVPLQDLLFPPGYQHLQKCPFVAERQRFRFEDLMIAQKSGKLGNVESLRNQEYDTRNIVDLERQESSNHKDSDRRVSDLIEVWECWADFDIDGDDLPERIVVTYHRDTREILQLRYNWYFHQQKPFTVIPYSITNDSLYGIGIGEMSSFFQAAQTQWHRLATDNAYLANIRMFIAKKESGIEEVPKMYAGRTFFVDNPATDFLPFQAAEIYPSTLQERQNLFGLAEKRTGVSDYLTGRESPIVGSRATATSTVALIQEGTRRVEEVLENVRGGFAEIVQLWMYIWIQYGLDGLDEIVFGGDDIADKLREFFDSVSADNVDGAIAIDLSATDAANNRSVQQQVQLAILQTMMQYLNKLVEAGQLAISAAQTQPVLTQLIGEVMESARRMFKDLLNKYDIRNPDDYLPDLQEFLNNAVAQGQGGAGVPPGQVGGAGTTPGLPPVPQQAASPTAAFAERRGVGDPNAPITPATG